MSWRRELFRDAWLADGKSLNAANSYATYLNRVERLCGDLDRELAETGADAIVERASRLPDNAYGGAKNRSDSLSALRAYVRLVPPPTLAVDGLETVTVPIVPEPALQYVSAAKDDIRNAALKNILVEVKQVAIRYRHLTGKPLGVTGEVAELAASDCLGIALAPVRTPGYDGTIERNGRIWRIQIKGRAVDPSDRYRGTCPSIKCDGGFDSVMLVLLDQHTLAPLEIWEAPDQAVRQRLSGVSAAKQARNALAITQFKSIAKLVWSADSAR